MSRRDLPVEGVGGGRLGEVVEEGGVEDGDVRDAREQLSGDVDAGEVRRVVQRRER
jgi:hypothetical protein